MFASEERWNISSEMEITSHLLNFLRFKDFIRLTAYGNWLFQEQIIYLFIYLNFCLWTFSNHSVGNDEVETNITNMKMKHRRYVTKNLKHRKKYRLYIYTCSTPNWHIIKTSCFRNCISKEGYRKELPKYFQNNVNCTNNHIWK